MGNTFYFGFEVLVMEWIQGARSLIGVSFFSFLTFFGESGVIVAVIAVFYLGFDKELGKTIGVNAACASAWNPLIKNIALRRRPYFDNPRIKCLKPVAEGDIYDIAAQGYSFPSGHAMASAAAYGSIPVAERALSKQSATRPSAAAEEVASPNKNNRENDRENNRIGQGTRKAIWFIAFFLPILVGISRVVLGVHYPTDVAFGWIAGWIIAFGLTEVQRRAKNEKLLHLILVLITLPGIFYCHTDDYYTALGVMIGFFIAIHFEEKFVNFSPATSLIKCILRVALAGVIFLGLNTLFKMPFDPAFLESGEKLAFLVRSVRYASIIFILMGIYPMAFKTKLLK